MPKQVAENELQAVLTAVGRFLAGASLDEILGAIDQQLPRRTLQRRLALLVKQQRLKISGRGRGSRYRIVPIDTEIRKRVGVRHNNQYSLDR